MEKDKPEVIDPIAIPDDESIAREALFLALVQARAPVNERDRMVAIRTLLEWTRAKPAAQKNITVHSAEAMLAALADDTDGDEGDA